MELKVKLKQHTPLIHFQWDQEGATLRATEVKPKLDRYIKELDKYYDKNVLEEVNKIPDGNGVYRLTVLQSVVKEKTIPKVLTKKEKKDKEYNSVEPVSRDGYKQKMIRSLYFGDIKAMLEYSDDVILQFQSFDQKILVKAILALPIMLALENFGARQNKGFGSFYIDGDLTINEFPDIKVLSNIEEIYQKYKEKTDNNVYFFDLESSDYIKVFEKIFYFYNALKAGTNERKKTDKGEKKKVYSKSLLWKYMRQSIPDLVWEKRVMKQLLIGDYILENLDPQNYLYIRILLGLSPIYEFKSTVDRSDIDHPIRMDNDYGDTRKLSIPQNVKFNVEHIADNNTEKLERTTSPITFKPVQVSDSYRVYIILKKELLTGINDLKFEFKFKKLEKNEQKFNNNGNFTQEKSFYLYSPTVDKFDLNKFMDFAANEINKKQVNEFLNDLRIEKLRWGGSNGK